MVAESCDNGVGDDGDALLDCADPNCGRSACGGGLTGVAGLCQWARH